jgi:hypothetical protein
VLIQSDGEKLPISLLETCLSSKMSVVLGDGPGDPRYNAVIDGNCLSDSPYLAVAIRGRGGSVVGAIIAVKKRGGVPYSQVYNQ